MKYLLSMATLLMPLTAQAADVCETHLVVTGKEENYVVGAPNMDVPPTVMFKVVEGAPQKGDCTSYTQANRIRMNSLRDMVPQLPPVEKGDVLKVTLQPFTPGPNHKFLNETYRYQAKIHAVKRNGTETALPYPLFYKGVGVEK